MRRELYQHEAASVITPHSGRLCLPYFILPSMTPSSRLIDDQTVTSPYYHLITSMGPTRIMGTPRHGKPWLSSALPSFLPNPAPPAPPSRAAGAPRARGTRLVLEQAIVGRRGALGLEPRRWLQVGRCETKLGASLNPIHRGLAWGFEWNVA